MDNRRQFERISTVNFIQFKRGLLYPMVDGLTKDVSKGGVCFFSEERMKIGQIVRVRVFLSERVKGRLRRARIAWCREHEDKFGQGFLYGLEFLPT